MQSKLSEVTENYITDRTNRCNGVIVMVNVGVTASRAPGDGRMKTVHMAVVTQALRSPNE